MQIFFQNGDLKYFQVATTLVPSDFDGYGGLPPDSFHQNDSKGCKRDYLDARDHSVLPFGAIGDKPLGGMVTTPLRKTRVKLKQMSLGEFLQCSPYRPMLPFILQ